MKAFKQDGFTYIEMLVALSIVACCFVPMLEMYAKSVQEVEHYSDISTAMNLARGGMEQLENLHLSEKQLESIGELWDPPLSEKPMEMNRHVWRVKRTIRANSRPLEVHVQVFDDRNRETPFFELATLFMDL